MTAAHDHAHAMHVHTAGPPAPHLPPICNLITTSELSSGPSLAPAPASRGFRSIGLAPLREGISDLPPCRLPRGATDRQACFKADGTTHKYRAYRRHKGRSAKAHGDFTYIGAGHCVKGFYSGWNPLEATSLKRCMAKCRSEQKCYAFALLPGKSCSRYNSEAGDCGLAALPASAAAAASQPTG